MLKFKRLITLSLCHLCGLSLPDQLLFPNKNSVLRPVGFKAHNLMLLSEAPDAKKAPSGDNAKLLTSKIKNTSLFCYFCWSSCINWSLAPLTLAKLQEFLEFSGVFCRISFNNWPLKPTKSPTPKNFRSWVPPTQDVCPM